MVNISLSSLGEGFSSLDVSKQANAKPQLLFLGNIVNVFDVKEVPQGFKENFQAYCKEEKNVEAVEVRNLFINTLYGSFSDKNEFFRLTVDDKGAIDEKIFDLFIKSCRFNKEYCAFCAKHLSSDRKYCGDTTMYHSAKFYYFKENNLIYRISDKTVVDFFSKANNKVFLDSLGKEDIDYLRSLFVKYGSFDEKSRFFEAIINSKKLCLMLPGEGIEEMKALTSMAKVIQESDDFRHGVEFIIFELFLFITVFSLFALVLYVDVNKGLPLDLKLGYRMGMLLVGTLMVCQLSAGDECMKPCVQALKRKKDFEKWLMEGQWDRELLLLSDPGK